VTIQRDAFYKWLPTANELPKTASPGPGDYVTMYEGLAREQEVREIVSIHMTSKGSGAYQAAMAAKSVIQESMPDLRVEVIDTLNVSMCQGWMVIEAARAALEGKSLSDIVGLVKRMMPITRMIQTADTLRYLYLGGRIGRAKHLIGSLLNIKPLIGMEDGEIVALGQVRNRNRAYQAMVDLVEAAVGRAGKIKIAYVHAAAQEEAEKIKQLFEQRLTCVESLIAELSPALGVHTGPGTAGVCYFPVLEADT
jgi:DegV family protein with EDD domain